MRTCPACHKEQWRCPHNCTDGPPRNLHEMTDRELYRLSFEVSEVLVERARIRLCAESQEQKGIVGRYEIARPTPAPEADYVFDSAEDNYTKW